MLWNLCCNSLFSIQYIPGSDAIIHKETAKLVQQAESDVNVSSNTPSRDSTMLSPRYAIVITTTRSHGYESSDRY